MAKYIKISDLEALFDEFKRDSFNGLINSKRLINRLTERSVINIPRINNIEGSIAELEKAAISKHEVYHPNKNSFSPPKYRELGRKHPVSLLAISEACNISRPTLTNWTACIMDLRGDDRRTDYTNGDYRLTRYSIDEIIAFLREVQGEQSKDHKL